MKELIEKYFNGETSNAEEKEIYNYFLSGNIDPELKEYERYFRGMAALKTHAKEIAMDEEVKRVMAMDSDEIRKNIPPDVMEMIKKISKEMADNIFPETETETEEICEEIPLQKFEGVPEGRGSLYPHQARIDGWRLSLVKRIGIALAVAASIALLILFFPFWHKSDSFIVLCGNEYSNENQVEGALLASLEDVRFEKKQMFNGSNNDLINLKNLMI